MDDTAYADSVTPTVKFIYTPGRLRVDSNQIGFSANDIDAICAIGSSTKVNEQQSTHSIGEKGIGFKSVFRVAKVVWLHSRNYSIKWDRAAKLGAIALEWASFPENVRNGQTSFLAELCRDEQEEQIVNDLENFDASLMLFLKKIYHVDIEVHREDGTCWTKSVIRRDIENSECHMCILQDGAERLTYLKIAHTAVDLPREPRRHARSTSELVLAFPLQQDPNRAPFTTTQNVCSGLPIGNHGLKVSDSIDGIRSLKRLTWPVAGGHTQSDDAIQFLLNADFILTASRQTIDVSLPWNMALRDSLSLALVKAFDQLNKSSCKYIWPWFTTVAAPSTFFEPALRDARQALASMRSLESCDGQLRLPKDLTYVDQTRFSGHDGCPMTFSTSTEDRYLSLKYPAWTIDSLLDLGVHHLTSEQFLHDLDHMISDDSVGFHAKSPKWHEDLGSVLLPQVDVPKLKEAIRQLNIIPLVDGSWTNSEMPKGRRLLRVPRPVFWPVNIDLCGSESKLPFSVVDIPSLENTNRRKLFERLDIKTLDLQRICNGIVAAHSTNGPGSFLDESTISSCALIAHAILLYQESWTPRIHPNPELWFVCGDGRRRRGSDLYVTRDAEDFSQPSGVSAILREMSPKLHLAYFDPAPLSYGSLQDDSRGCVSSSHSRGDFVDYLVRTFRTSIVPRLVENNALNACDFTLSDDFRDLFERYRASCIFQLILDKWESYSPWIELDELHRHCEECLDSRARLLREIRELPSGIEHGPQNKILDIVLSDVDPLIQDGGVNLPVLQVSDFEDEVVRNRLHCLGITTRRGFAFYLKCLKAIRRQTAPSEEQLAYLYEQMEAYYDGDKDEVEYVSASLFKSSLTLT